jgi:hypothetical protein
LIVTTSCRVPAIASTNQGPEKGDSIADAAAMLKAVRKVSLVIVGDEVLQAKVQSDMKRELN